MQDDGHFSAQRKHIFTLFTGAPISISLTHLLFIHRLHELLFSFLSPPLVEPMGAEEARL